MIKNVLLFTFLLMVQSSLAFGNIESSSKLSEKSIQKLSIYFKKLERRTNKPTLTKKVGEIFNQLGPEFNIERRLLKLQAKINKKPFRFKNCITNYNNYRSNVSKYHLLQVLRFCHTKLLNSKSEQNLSVKEKGFVEKYYETLVKTGNLGLIRLRSKKSVFPKVLADVISLNKFDIDDITSLFQKTYIGKHIHYGEKLTEHLQSTGIFPAKESKLFRKEFRQLVATFLKDKDPKEQSRILEQILSFYSENAVLIGHRYSNKKFRQISRNLCRANRHKTAKRFISRSIEAQTKSHRADLYFERLYIDLLKNDYASALKFINRSGLLGIEQEYSSKLRFWIARIFLRQNEKALAEFLFKSQITKTPLSYYSVLSAAHLDKLGNRKFLEESYLYKSQSNISIFKDEDEKSQNDHTRLRLWMKTQSHKFAKLEIKEIIKKSKSDQKRRNIASHVPNTDTSFEILKLFQEEDDYLKSFRFFSRSNLVDSFNFLPMATKILFPTPFLKEINKSTRGLDPILILSLIRQESAFNPRAKSRVGARGLMQLMPATARMYKKRLRKSDLYKPKLNLALGTKYLGRLYSKYNKSLIRTLAAYNAGETNVRRWEKKYFNVQDDLLKVESIPFHETEGYVKYITRNMFFYKIIFGEPLLSGLEWVTDSV